MRRHLVRIILAAAMMLTAAVLMLAPSPAYAAPLDCKTPPLPVSTKDGMSGLFTDKNGNDPFADQTGNPDKPDPFNKSPADLTSADPFTDQSVPIADVYGYSWSLHTYDLGCGPGGAVEQMWRGTVSDQAERGMDAAASWLALLGAIESYAKTSSIEWFGQIPLVNEKIKPILTGGTSAVGVVQFGLIPAAFMIAAIVIVWKARGGDMADLAKTLLIAMVSVFLFSLTLFAPVATSAGVDKITQQTATLAGSAFNASLTDGAHRNSVYRAWLTANFGSADTAIAKEYGPRLKEATHYTWAESVRAEADPKARAEINKAKNDRYEKLASEVKEKDPQAYRHLQGKEDRVGPSTFGMIAGFFMSLFAAVSYTIVLLARIMMQALVLVAPFVAAAGLLPKGDKALGNLLGLFLASLWAVFKFSLAAGVMGIILGVLSTMSPVAALIWMTLASIVGLILLKPFKAFKSMMPGMDASQSYTKKAMGTLAKVAALFIAAKAGGKIAGTAAAGAVDSSPVTGPSGMDPYRPALGSGTPRERVDLSMPKPPGPPPVRWEPVPGTNRHRVIEAPAEPPRSQLAAVPPVGPQSPAALGRARDPEMKVTVTVRHESPHHSTVDQAKVVIAGEVVDESVYQPPVLKRADGTVDRIRPKIEEAPTREVELFQSDKV